jgi:outer membrane protein assembly factor BamB
VRCLIALQLLFTFGSSAWAGDDWTAFRGGPRAGVAETPLAETWSADRNVVWKADIAGRGWSSPVVVGDRVFVTSAVSDGKVAEPRKGLYITDLSGTVPPGEHRWLVHCLDWTTGKTLWTREAARGVPAAAVHLKNSCATETPVTDGQRIYAYFGNVGVFCYDLAGKEVWSRKWPAVKTRMGWGTAASPALHGDRLFIVNDNQDRSYLVCLDKRTGKSLWEVERDEKSNWATPFVWQHEQRTEIVAAGSNRVRSYDLDGKLLWELRGMSEIAIPTPFAANGLLFVTSGYVLDLKAKPVYAIRPGAEGDISLKPEETASKWIAWSLPQAGPYHPTPLVHGDYLYILYDRGFLSCYEAKTGKTVYEKQRVGSATAFTASPWAAGNRIYCLSEDGDTFVLRAGPKFEVLGKNGLDEMCLATPAPARGSMLIRTQTKLYRIGR